MKVTVLTNNQQTALAAARAALATAASNVQAASTALTLAQANLQQRLDAVTGLPGTLVSDDGTALVNL